MISRFFRQVLRRVHPNSLADQWTRRSGRRLVGNLLLLSVNGQEDEEEIMCPGKPWKSKLDLLVGNH
jgi:hypothetical protein